MIPLIISDANVVVVSNAKPYVFPTDDPRSDKVIKVAMGGNAEELRCLLDSFQDELKTAAGDLLQILGQRVEIRHGYVYVNGVLNEGNIAERILSLRQRGVSPTSLMAFLARLQLNPNPSAANCLYNFLETNQMPLTPEGKVVAWKVVGEDYLDIHSRTIPNHVGTVVKVDRSEVDSDPNKKCSHGLHVCGEKYIPHYGSSQRQTDRVLLVFVDPADFCAVPSDYTFAKARVCEYFVAQEMDRETAATYLVDRANFTFESDDPAEDEYDYMDDEPARGRSVDEEGIGRDPFMPKELEAHTLICVRLDSGAEEVMPGFAGAWDWSAGDHETIVEYRVDGQTEWKKVERDSRRDPYLPKALDPFTMVLVRLKNGYEDDHPGPASFWNWAPVTGLGDNVPVCAYQIEGTDEWVEVNTDEPSYDWITNDGNQPTHDGMVDVILRSGEGLRGDPYEFDWEIEQVKQDVVFWRPVNVPQG